MERITVKSSLAGYDFLMSMPTVEQIDKFAEAAALFRKCVLEPTGAALAEAIQKKPGIPLSMGLALLQAARTKGPIEELEESEFTDEIAEQLIKFQGSGELHVIRVTSAINDFTKTIIAREPNRHELAALEKNGRVLVCKKFIRDATVWPVGDDKKLDCSELDQQVPGFYVAATNLLSERAGLVLDATLGEA